MVDLDLVGMAAQFVNSTSRHIFLTGKAGTGKTTFLRQLVQTTHKRCLVVAPTGIAALNAQGVTIHSQFLLPIGTFIPDRNAPIDLPELAGCFNARTMAAKNPLNGPRREVLRSIELLIIDEVSMLRADVLDAVDQRLRSVRADRTRTFGGVQVLFIGDLLQLPPVVRDHERDLMERYYPSPHFFEAWALKENAPVHIELEKVYRQSEARFIDLLNNLRNNTVTREDVDLLNQHHQPNVDVVASGIVTLTTHNRTADELNAAGLESLRTPKRSYSAKVEGDFPASSFPVNEVIDLKEGAQIMFTKNHRDGLYHNGTLAKVTRLDKDDIEVTMIDNAMDLVLSQETWQNKRYTVNAKSRDMDEEVIGTFTQYPIKLAWAITVHKSQGLTFDKAIIDVGRAFAPGQVYVALSRLRTLGGLVLHTRIDPKVVTIDPLVAEFNRHKDDVRTLDTKLRQEQTNYLWNIISTTFNFKDISEQIENVMRRDVSSTQFTDTTMRNALPELLAMVQTEDLNSTRFRHQAMGLLKGTQTDFLLERLKKAQLYYSDKLSGWIKHILVHLEMLNRLSLTKQQRSSIAEIDILLTGKLANLIKIGRVAADVIEGKLPERDLTEAQRVATLREKLSQEAKGIVGDWKPEGGTSGKTRTKKERRDGAPRPERVKKTDKIDTALASISLLNDGLNIAEIAIGRGLQPTTIEGHMAKGIAQGTVKIQQLMSDQAINELLKFHKEHGDKAMSEAFQHFEGRYSYGQLRMVQAHLGLKKPTGE